MTKHTETKTLTGLVNVGDEQREVTIFINADGNIEIQGVGTVLHEMYNEELILMDAGEEWE